MVKVNKYTLLHSTDIMPSSVIEVDNQVTTPRTTMNRREKQKKELSINQPNISPTNQ